MNEIPSFLNNATSFDFLCVFLIFALVINGILVGFLRDVVAWGLLGIGIYTSFFTLVPESFGQLLSGIDEVPEPSTIFFCRILILMFACLIGSILSRITFFHNTLPVFLDRILGGILGFSKGIVLVVLLVSLAHWSKAEINIPSINESIFFSIESMKISPIQGETSSRKK